jgi:uncharacterized protein
VVLADTGPLIALLSARDRHHQACRRAAEELHDDIGTTWPVLTEAVYLLSGAWKAQAELFAWLERGDLLLFSLHLSDVPRIRTLMRTYRNLPMALADASLVRVAERERIRRVFTVDRRDFSVYRAAGLGALDLIP